MNSKNAVHTQLFSNLNNFPKTIYESPDRLYLRALFGDALYTIKSGLEKTSKYLEMGLYRARYEVFKNEGELVLYCENLQTVKHRDAELARKNAGAI